MKAMYVSFIRPVMEYGSMQFMGADKIHLEKFDKIQRRAMKIGNFKVNFLRVRREANAIGFYPQVATGWIDPEKDFSWTVGQTFYLGWIHLRTTHQRPHAFI